MENDILKKAFNIYYDSRFLLAILPSSFSVFHFPFSVTKI